MEKKLVETKKSIKPRQLQKYSYVSFDIDLFICHIKTILNNWIVELFSIKIILSHWHYFLSQIRNRKAENSMLTLNVNMVYSFLWSL